MQNEIDFEWARINRRDKVRGCGGGGGERGCSAVVHSNSAGQYIVVEVVYCGVEDELSCLAIIVRAFVVR